MSLYPLDTDQRISERKRLAERIMTEARAKAQRAGCSLKCAGMTHLAIGPLHAFEGGGCANDGSGCLCECHDPAPAEARA